MSSPKTPFRRKKGGKKKQKKKPMGKGSKFILFISIIVLIVSGTFCVKYGVDIIKSKKRGGGNSKPCKSAV